MMSVASLSAAAIAAISMSSTALGVAVTCAVRPPRLGNWSVAPTSSVPRDTDNTDGQSRGRRPASRSPLPRPQGPDQDVVDQCARGRWPRARVAGPGHLRPAPLAERLLGRAGRGQHSRGGPFLGPVFEDQVAQGPADALAPPGGPDGQVGEGE